MFGKIVLVLSVLAWASGQIPNIGFCPEYVPMVNFNMQRFMGIWHEAERYFQLSEVVSRCVTTNYTKGVDGKYRVINEVTNRLTGIKRVLEGEIKPPASKAEEGKLHVKYTTIPLTPETKYSVLETDYNSYAVLWSCQGIGPIHTQNAWVMTRQRIAPGEVLQKAYGILDKYKISKTFFVKTDQEDCAYLDAPPQQPATEKTPKRPTRPQRPQKPTETKPTETKPTETKPTESSRFAIDPEETGAKKEAEANVPSVKVSSVPDVSKITVEEPVESKPNVETVPERILKVAEVKEEDSDSKNEKEISAVKKENAEKTV